MSAKHDIHDDNLMDHEYDGIRELDNRLPPWWLNLFYITIIWGVGYMFYYHFFAIGDLQIAEYYKEMNMTVPAHAGDSYKPLRMFTPYRSPYYSPQPDLTPAMLAQSTDQPAAVETVAEEPAETVEYELLTSSESLANGKRIFDQNCANCHGQLGEGGIGPNLTDNYWISGDGGYQDIIAVIRNGVPIKGMIAWKGYLRPQQILEVGSYVHSLQGTSPPNPKPPQGTKIEGT